VQRRLELTAGIPHYCLLIALSGEGTISGQTFRKGQVWFVPACSPAVLLESENAEWLMTYAGTEPPPAVYAS
jgi:hypothetical protein